MNLYALRKFGFAVGSCWLVAITFGSHTALAIQNLKVGDPMPAFSLPRADTTPGQYTSEQLKGRPAAIVFWRPNQKLSLEALGDLQEIVAKIGPEKLRILAVNTSRSSAQEVKAALSGKNLSFPILLDSQRDLYGKVGVIVCPTTLLLDAKGVLRFVVASHPRQFSQVIRARLRHLLGEIDEQQMSKEIEPTVLKIEHDLAAAWRMYNLGRKLQAEGKSQQAMAIYEKAVSQYPSLPEARCALGFMRLAAGNFDAATQHFQTALAYQPASRTARLGQAAVLARTGQPKQAEQTLLSLLGHKSSAVRVRYELGRIYQASGEIDKAVTFYQDALSTLFPEPKLPSAEVTPPQVAVATPTPPLEPRAEARGKPRKPTSTPTKSASPPSPAPAETPQPTQTVQAIVPPADAQYVGVKRCKKCHLQQWKSWKDTKMGKTFEVLKPGQGTEVKAGRNLDPQKDYTTDPVCLGCHTNGFGHSGGYQIPPAGDAAAARAAQANAGIGCESCHGPGSKYMPIHKDIQDNTRQYTQAELFKAGQYRVDARVCAACHQEKAPCIGPGYVFEFEKRKDQGTHKHYDLKFRAQ